VARLLLEAVHEPEGLSMESAAPARGDRLVGAGGQQRMIEACITVPDHHQTCFHGSVERRLPPFEGSPESARVNRTEYGSQLHGGTCDVR